MESYRNIFKEKNDDELKLLYGQFLEFEKTGVIIGKELGEIRHKYAEWFKGGVISMLQYDLLHSLSDLWYCDKMK